MQTPDDILDLWLTGIGPDGWFAGGAAIDARCRTAAPLFEAALAGRLEHWLDGPRGTLAFLILTDQLSRNMHRGTARAFAADPLARAAARRALDRGWDLQVPEPARQFLYLPFAHSEDMADQDLSVRLMTTRLSDPDTLLHARAHRAVIARFGRFPFRNAALGRLSTPAEARFLDAGGYPALVRAMQAAQGGTDGWNGAG